jgi:hypothetical protein
LWIALWDRWEQEYQVRRGSYKRGFYCLEYFVAFISQNPKQ